MLSQWTVCIEFVCKVLLPRIASQRECLKKNALPTLIACVSLSLRTEIDRNMSASKITNMSKASTITLKIQLLDKFCNHYNYKLEIFS